VRRSELGGENIIIFQKRKKVNKKVEREKIFFYTSINHVHQVFNGREFKHAATTCCHSISTLWVDTCSLSLPPLSLSIYRATVIFPPALFILLFLVLSSSFSKNFALATGFILSNFFLGERGLFCVRQREMRRGAQEAAFVGEDTSYKKETRNKIQLSPFLSNIHDNKNCFFSLCTPSSWYLVARTYNQMPSSFGS
jgi:hypothetical protein